MSQTPDLSEVIFAAMDVRLEGVFTASPGIVTGYDPKTRTVDVQPAIKGASEDELGNRVAEAHPVVRKVPLISWALGNYHAIAPVSQGETVLLVHLHASRDRWQWQGGLVDPVNDWRHDLHDCVAICGLRSLKDNLGTLPPTDSMFIGHQQGFGIYLDEDELRLGANDDAALDNIALKSDLEQLKSALVTAKSEAASDVAAGSNEPASSAAVYVLEKIISALGTGPGAFPQCSPSVKATK